MIAERFSPELKETLQVYDYDVVIVGAGISGLSLASNLDKNVNCLVIDKRVKGEYKSAMYLVSERIAQTWGIEGHYQARRRQQKLISGIELSDETGTVIESIPADPHEKRGFVSLPQTLVENNLILENDINIHYGEICDKVEINEDCVKLNTNGGSYRSQLVIDATGWRGDIFHKNTVEKPYSLVSLYGGHYPVDNLNPELLQMIAGRKNNKVNWVMPVSDKGAEVMAAQIVDNTEIANWWSDYGESELDQMISWYEKSKDVKINRKNHRTEGMAFRIQPARREAFDGRIFPFGEAAGFNSSTHGQLIDVLPQYSEVLGKLINSAKLTGNWKEVGEKFYKQFIENPPFKYLMHTIARENIKRSDDTRSPNAILFQAMNELFPPQALWDIAQANGITSEQIRVLLTKKPLAVAGWIYKSAPAFVSTLISEPELYTQFISGIRQKLLNTLLT